MHLAHALGNNWGHRRVKNDERDATDLVDLLRMGRLAEAWVAPPAWRELVRYRAKLVHLRTGLKAQVHAVLAKEGVTVPMDDLFGTAGTALLDTCRLGEAYTLRVESLRDILEVVDGEITMLAGRIQACLVERRSRRRRLRVGEIGVVSDHTSHRLRVRDIPQEPPDCDTDL